MINKSIWTVFYISITLISKAQFKKIAGQVTDFNNNPIARAVISFKGTKANSTMTDTLGRYVTVRNLMQDTIIYCTHVNYRSSEIKILGNNIINFRLHTNEDGYVLPTIIDSIQKSTTSDNEEQKFTDSLSLANKGKILTKVEMKPEFYGGEYALKAYYLIGLRNSKLTLPTEIDGTVSISFTIKKDGLLTNIKLIKGVDKRVDAEILRLTAQSPKWKPALQNGKYCDYNYVLTIPIKLKAISI